MAFSHLKKLPREKKEDLTFKTKLLVKKFKKQTQELFFCESFGLEFSNKLSETTTKLIRSLGRSIANQAHHPLIVATGGFGRGELAPYSDIDLLYLIDSKASEQDKRFIKSLNEALWNAGLKPGFSVHTLEQSQKAMSEDINFLTSLLEMRLIAGNKEIYRRLVQLVQSHLDATTSGAFIAAKLEERDLRHKKMGDSRYQLEPNVKESKGGLRDIQTLLWLTNFTYGIKTPEDLVRKSILTESEATTLKSALRFFWQVRCHLHLTTGRDEDRLSFDIQPQIAERMGYAEAEPNIRAEKFMRDYFRLASETGHLTRILCADMEARALVSGATAGTKKLSLHDEIEGFPIYHNRLTVSDKNCFTKNPADLLRIFRASQVSGYDIHPDALRTMKENGVQNVNPEILLDIILDKKNAEQILRRMNEAGVLSRVIPEFANIHAHMQYDMYHVFTADEHTIRAVGMLHKIENGELAKAAKLATGLFEKIHSRRALYTAMFLHDIAKGMGGQHSQKGADIARRLSPRLGLSAEETETAAWLVENHLLMTMTAFKRDLNDDKTIADFVAAVQSPERLKLLAILTTADIMAVGPDRWNNWKSGLLDELYHKSHKALAGMQDNRQETDLIVIAQKKARRLVGEGKEALQYLIDKAPGNFWTNFLAEDIARYARYLSPDPPGQTTIKINPHAAHDFTEIFICTPDRKGLFATLSGAMAASGASIADARIFTLSDGTALDIFQVQNLNGHVYENMDFIRRVIKDALTGRIDLDEEIRERQKHASRKTRLFHVETRIIIDNNASASCTLIEVNGKDRPGFLYDVTSTLTHMGLQIAAAKITTFGARAVDTFYVKDSFGLKILHAKKLLTIEKSLKTVLENKNR